MPQIDVTAFRAVKVISRGTHSNLSKGCSVMEAVSIMSGEAFGDRPRTACPVISSFLRNWGDALPDKDRTKILLTVVAQFVDTKSTPEIEAKRSETVFSWLSGPYLRMWLNIAGVKEGLTLEATKHLAEKRWDEVSSAYRTASGQMVTERAMNAIEQSGLMAGMLASKVGGWSPERDRELLVVQSICASCAKIYAKLTAKASSLIKSQDTGGNGVKLIDRDAEAQKPWEEFDEFVYSLQKEARKLVRLMAKM